MKLQSKTITGKIREIEQYLEQHGEAVEDEVVFQLREVAALVEEKLSKLYDQLDSLEERVKENELHPTCSKGPSHKDLLD